jgi:hypothetical protein
MMRVHMNKLFVFVFIGVFSIISHVYANDPVSYTKRAEFKQIYYFEQQKLKKQAVEDFRAIKKEITDPKTKKVNRKHSLYKKYVVQQRKAQTGLKSKLDPRVQEKRYRDQVGASIINRKRIEMDTELKEITQRHELELKNKNITKGTPEFDAVKNAWQDDFKQTRSKTITSILKICVIRVVLQHQFSLIWTFLPRLMKLVGNM